MNWEWPPRQNTPKGQKVTDDQIDELINRARTATAFSRLSFAECRDVLRWLTHNGHVTFTGKPLSKAPAQGRSSVPSSLTAPRSMGVLSNGISRQSSDQRADLLGRHQLICGWPAGLCRSLAYYRQADDRGRCGSRRVHDQLQRGGGNHPRSGGRCCARCGHCCWLARP